MRKRPPPQDFRRVLVKDLLYMQDPRVKRFLASEVPVYHIPASFINTVSGPSPSSALFPSAGGVPPDHKLQGHLAHEKMPTPKGPHDPRHGRAVGS